MLSVGGVGVVFLVLLVHNVGVAGVLLNVDGVVGSCVLGPASQPTSRQPLAALRAGVGHHGHGSLGSGGGGLVRRGWFAARLRYRVKRPITVPRPDAASSERWRSVSSGRDVDVSHYLSRY